MDGKFLSFAIPLLLLVYSVAQGDDWPNWRGPNRNGVSTEATNMSLLGMVSYKLGRSIRWDGRNEKIIGDDDANKLLRREYRGPWKYPSA